MTAIVHSLNVERQRRLKAHATGTVIIKLICLDVTQESLTQAFEGDAEALAHLNDMRGWLNDCWATTGAGSGKKLSTELLRRADREKKAVDKARVAVIGDCTTVPAWAAWLVCLDALLHDTVVQWEGAADPCWQSLAQAWDSLADKFSGACIDDDRAEEIGTELYFRLVEELKWA